MVVSRALSQLVRLTGLTTGDDEVDEVTFPNLAVDLSRGNFHGVSAPDYAPEGSFLAVASDLAGGECHRMGSLRRGRSSPWKCLLHLRKPATSDLGNADVDAADFTGANLRGADLSEVRNLTATQLAGALIGPSTLLPPDVDPPPQPGWGVRRHRAVGFIASNACRHLMDMMTNLAPGSGYSSRLHASPRTSSRLGCPPLRRRRSIGFAHSASI